MLCGHLILKTIKHISSFGQIVQWLERVHSKQPANFNQDFPEAKIFSLFEKKLVIFHFFTPFKITKSCVSFQLKLKTCALLSKLKQQEVSQFLLHQLRNLDLSY